MSKQDHEKIIVQFSGYCYPTLVPANNEKWKRGWVLRCGRPIPDESSTSEMCRRIEHQARDTITDALRDRFDPGILEEGFPTVDVLRVDSNHAILWITSRHPEQLGADVSMAGLIGVLRAFDALFRIEEVQGLPRKFWVFFFPPEDESRATV